MRIRVKSTQKKVVLNLSKISGLTKKIMRSLGLTGNTELSLLFVNDAQIRKLNKIYRRRDRITDVLAFSMREGRNRTLNPQLLGDIVISAQTCVRNAKHYRNSKYREITLYIIHGLLHLLGCKDKTKSQRERMTKKQKATLKNIFR